MPNPGNWSSPLSNCSSSSKNFLEFREMTFAYKARSVIPQPPWRMDAFTHKGDKDVVSVSLSQGGLD